MQSCDVAHQIIEAVARYLSRGVEVDAAELLHDIGVVGHLEVGHKRLAETLDFHVLGVVPADRYGGRDHLRNLHHDVRHLRAQLGFLFLERRELLRLSGDLLLERHRLFLLLLRHQHSDLLGDLVSVGAQVIRLLLCRTALRVKRDDLVYQSELVVLELLLDVLLDRVGIFT